MSLEEKKRIKYSRDVARKIIKDYFKANPPFRLPIPIYEIAEFLEFEVYELENLSKHQRAITSSFEGRKFIGLNSSYHIHNKRFSLGHEIAHHLLNHPPESDCDEEEIKMYNQEADEFSAELLIPYEELKKQLQATKDTNVIAKNFQVSKEALWIKITSQRLLKVL